MKKLAPGSVAAFISDELYLSPTSSEFLEVYGNTIKYIMGVTSAFEYQKNLKALMKPIGKSSKVFRLALLQNSYVFPLKLFTLRLALKRSLNADDARPLVKEFGVKVSDAKRILSLLISDNAFRIKMRKSARSLSERIDLTMAFSSDLFERIYKSVLTYVKAIVYRKLRFISKSENQPLSDLIGDVMLKVIQAYYKLMPSYKTDAYVGNYLRRAAHNHVMNMIQAGTSKKCGRLVNTGVDTNNQRQFAMVVVSENQMNVNKVEGEEVDYDAIGGGHNPMPQFELKLSIEQLVDRARKDKKRFRLLMLLMGTEHRRFTDWLKARNLCRNNESNVDVQLRTHPKMFNKLVARFMHLPPERMSYILNSIRVDLGAKKGVGDASSSISYRAAA